MFRVLGYLAGRAATIAVDVYQRIQGNDSNQNNSSSVDRYVAGSLTFAATAALPLPLRIPAVLALTLPYVLGEVRQLTETRPASDPVSRSMACYLRAAEQSDPFLISPGGTLPYERCLE